MSKFYLMALYAALVTVSSTLGCSKSETTPSAQDSQAAGSVTLANDVCPLMGGKAKESVTVEWNGKTVGFCCADCIPGWEELSDEEKATKLAEAQSEDANETQDDASGENGSPAA